MQGEATDTRARELNHRKECRLHTAYTKREAIPHETT
jgi:hypothetical protein